MFAILPKSSAFDPQIADSLTKIGFVGAWFLLFCRIHCNPQKVKIRVKTLNLQMWNDLALSFVFFELNFFFNLKTIFVRRICLSVKV